MREIFQRAMERAPRDRASFLDDACGADSALRGEVESLLSVALEARAFMEKPRGTDDQVTAPLPKPGPAGPQPLEGSRVGHYQIEERIGEGGMGVVYRATDLKLGRTVALKFLFGEDASDWESRARFLREAQAAAGLDHPNIASVYEIGEAEGHLYIAMGYYHGATLKERLRGGPLPIAEILSIARDLARGLGAAHGASVIHRDLKPANVMITTDGHVKVLDFGLAKRLRSSPEESSGLTRGGMVMGTVAYMSPEQARGEEVDRRTDLWGLGVIIYEMLAGRHPFERGSPTATVTRILTEEPPTLREIRPDAPGFLVDLVQALLQKQRENRPGSAAAVSFRLDDPAAGRPSAPRPRVLAALVGAAVIALGVVLGVTLSRRPRPLAPRPKASLVPLPCRFSGEEPSRYLERDVPDVLASTLSQVEALRVRSPPSPASWDPDKEDLALIASQYDVNHCVTCAVSASGDARQARSQAGGARRPLGDVGRPDRDVPPRPRRAVAALRG